ncbi:hypothetical protein K505DRAFT_296219 [Melanomma pulvis-pyrius CBS 109.77]|uniref:Rhodopsin domain-containing protein n=1 Tax=Melanomma pulvis-pyrius CBS 109.77 TaxID=1314802 RepID=A0A6A6XQB2_9PLEO|nr:hypothetical protein K505DRAFT_296219 [Melanomma pulvis-pyrius CBS 109.77]
MRMNTTQREIFLQLPALNPPDGIEPNFVNPDDLHTSTIISCIILVILSTMAVGMRAFTKFKLVGTHIEDYFILVSWVIFIAGFQLPAVLMFPHLKVGAHQWNVTMEELMRHLKVRHSYVLSINYTAGIFFLKAAINLQGLRVFCPKGARDITFFLWHALLWGNNIFYLYITIAGIFSCRPINKAWDITITSGHCTNRLRGHSVAAILNTTSDVLMLAMAQRGIWRLRLSLRKRLSLSAMFLVGAVACVFAAIRIPPALKLSHTTDVTYYMARMGRWTGPEYVCGLLAACLPVLPRFCIFLGAQPAIKNNITAMQGVLRLWSGRMNPSGSDEESQKDKSKVQTKGRNILGDVVVNELTEDTGESSINTSEFGRYSESTTSKEKPLEFVTLPTV